MKINFSSPPAGYNLEVFNSELLEQWFREIVKPFVDNIVALAREIPTDSKVEARQRSREDVRKKRRELMRRKGL
jgi:hypothetical protein